MSTAPEATTAAAFREPLLKALGRLTDLKAGIPVSMEHVLNAVYTETGFSEDQFGVDAPTGASRIRVLIQQAFNKNLRYHALADAVDRGMWTLTTKGVGVATTLLGNPEPTTVVSVPAPLFDGGVGEAWTLGRQTNTYNPDPYIRGLAVSSTPCFGEFSDRSDVCGSCPISGACKGMVISRLSGLAETLRVRDIESKRKAEEAVKRAEEAAKQALNPVPAPIPPDVDGDNIEDILAAIEADTSAGKEMEVPVSSKCARCRDRVEKGSRAIYVDGTGVYHPSCYKEIHP